MKAKAIWTPQPGSQVLFLTCPFFECLFEGSRGPGKTDSLLMDFAQHTGQGFGAAWRGVLFRESYPQLADVISKSKRWFKQIFPAASYNASDHTWTWPTGEQLLLRHMKSVDDYWNYHGHEYPWIAWEELTNWSSLECYDIMKSCCRSSFPGMPRKYRATANPFGRGHTAVKARFIDPAPPGVPVKDERGRIRVRIHGNLYENKILLANDPEYIKNLEGDPNENRRKAWLLGDWDIVAGGAIDDVWDARVHVIEPFEIPSSWRLDRSFDWGSSKPFSVGWWAESDGTDAKFADGTARSFPRGTIFRIAEFYGWNGNPNEGCKMLAVNVARKIKEIEPVFRQQVFSGPADTSIFDTQNGNCIADDMAIGGIKWDRANKSPGSRKTGLEALRKYLGASLVQPMEEPGLFVFSTCRHFIRTVPVLPRDSRDPDDVDSATEDHVYDDTRYRLTFKCPTATTIDFPL